MRSAPIAARRCRSATPRWSRRSAGPWLAIHPRVVGQPRSVRRAAPRTDRPGILRESWPIRAAWLGLLANCRGNEQTSSEVIERSWGVAVNRREWTPASIQHVSELRPGTDGPTANADELASFVIEHLDAGVVVRVSGEIDMLTTPRLRGLLSELIEARPRVVVLDMAAVSFFASSGLATLVEARDAAAARGVLLRLACLSRSVRRPLQITGLTARFE